MDADAPRCLCGGFDVGGVLGGTVLLVCGGTETGVEHASIEGAEMEFADGYREIVLEGQFVGFAHVGEVVVDVEGDDVAEAGCNGYNSLV